MTIKNSKCIKNFCVNPFYPIFSNVNVYFEENNENKYLTLVPTNESKEKIKKYEELWIKIKDLNRSITKNTDDYNGKYMKIKFNSDNELPLNKTIEIHKMRTVVRAIVHGNNIIINIISWKAYPQVFLDECVYKT